MNETADVATFSEDFLGTGLDYSPNRMKFARMVCKLQPNSPDFVHAVSVLYEDFERRRVLIDNLISVIASAAGIFSDLKDPEVGTAIRAAVEGFVVDNY